MFCTKCGQECPDNSAFCTRCGAPLKPPPTNNNHEPVSPKKSMPVWAWILVSLAGVFVVLGLFAHISFSYDPSDPDGSHTLSVDFGIPTPSESCDSTDSGLATVPAAPTIPIATEAYLEETVIYDDKDIKITALELDNNAMYCKEITFLMENNSSRNIGLWVDNFIVNGITINTYLDIEAAAGKKAYGFLQFDNEDLDGAGIQEICSVFSPDATIYDTDSDLRIDNMTISLETTAAGNYVQTIDDSGDVLYDQNGIKVISKPVDKFYDETVIHLLFINDSGYDLSADVENISINGITIDRGMYADVFSGTVNFYNYHIYDFDLEPSKIDKIEEITFSIVFRRLSTSNTIAKTEELRISIN